jgi:hypothetical protein
MLVAPRRPLLVRLLARLAAPWASARNAGVADLRYLDTMSAERLERDLGLTRTRQHDYRPY